MKEKNELKNNELEAVTGGIRGKSSGNLKCNNCGKTFAMSVSNKIENTPEGKNQYKCPYCGTVKVISLDWSN